MTIKIALILSTVLVTSISGCSSTDPGLSSYSGTDQIVDRLLESGIPCYDPDSSPNYSMNARELICHDSKGDGYWIYLFDTRETMVARLVENQDCSSSNNTGIHFGENWYFEGGLGAEGVGEDRIVSALGGILGTEADMLGCSQ